MDLNTTRSQAQSTAQNATNIEQSAPGLLSELKKNLVSIYAKDNPVMQARDTALSDYLSSNARTRASVLPTNMPQIEGSNLNLSPTQQNAIVSARSAASLAPLAGYNEILKAQYGNIGDMVQGAAGLYGSQVESARNQANNAMELYKLAIAEEDARKSSSGIVDQDLISLILGAMNGGQVAGASAQRSGFFDDVPTTSGPSLSSIKMKPVPGLNLNAPTANASASIATAPAKPGKQPFDYQAFLKTPTKNKIDPRLAFTL